MNNDRVFYQGGTKGHNLSGGSYNSSTTGIDSFKKLTKAKKEEKQQALFNIFNSLNENMRKPEAETHKKLFDIYSGNDQELKDQLQKFLGNNVNISAGFETNALVKTLYTKILQPFLSQDNILTVTPKDKNIKLAEKCQALFNDQIKSEDFIEEITKTLKDGFIYGKGYLSLGWKKEIKVLPKKIIHKTTSTNERGEEITSTTFTYEDEEITIESPDFRSEKPSNILHPQVSRWKDVPFAIRMETVSVHEYNNRYTKKEDELILADSLSSYELDFDRVLSRMPVTGENFGGATDNQIDLLHFYFKDETYYVCKLYGASNINQDHFYGGLELVYEGRSPVAGVAIPIYIFIPEPVTGRLTGESLVAVAMQDQRKVTEFDNLYAQSMRNNAMSPIFYNASAGLNVKNYLERMPNMPIEIQGDMDSIKKMDLEQINPALLQLSGYYSSRMKETLGATDFFSGNIGRSSRLSSVDSLIGLASARMSSYISQFNKFILEIADGLVLLNRAFLPETYVNLASSLYQPEPIESFSIPYPIKFNINTPIQGMADLSVRLAAIRECVTFAQQQEQMQAGTWDMVGLSAYFFATAGIKEIGKFMLKSPFTEAESDMLKTMDSINRLMTNSTLPNTETPQGMPQQPQDSNQMQQGSFNNQSMQTAPLEEQTGGI